MYSEIYDHAYNQYYGQLDANGDSGDAFDVSECYSRDSKLSEHLSFRVMGKCAIFMYWYQVIL